MDKIISVTQVIAPIFLAITLGYLARKKNILKSQEAQGLQQFVLKFGLPCLILKSYLKAEIGVEALGTMALLLPLVTLSTLWAFRARKEKFPYHNLPKLFCAQETGMVGIPLFTILFGAEYAYLISILNLTQAIVTYPTMGILSAAPEETLDPRQILKSILRSPMVIMCIAGLTLNLTGTFRWMDSIGIGAILTESIGFLATPVSALMIFCVGYNFSLAKDSRKEVFKISAIHLCTYLVIGALVQLGLFLLPNVNSLTRWSVLLYSFLPPSYLAPSFGRRAEEYTMASTVCSMLSLVCLILFCVMAVMIV